MDDDGIGKIVDLAEARPPSWLKRLKRNDKGIIANVANAMIIMGNDPQLADLATFNAFTSQPLMLRPPPAPEEGARHMPGPYPRLMEDTDLPLLQAYMQRVWSPMFGKGTVQDATISVAVAHQFHPVTDWLATLEWDGTRRIDHWLSSAFGADDTAYHRAVGAKFLIAGARRPRHPGCKFDHMMILEGSQGIGKSTAARVLFGDEWFSDSIPPDLSSKDAAMALLGVWCLEFGEIEHLIRNEPETIKAFLSRQTDRYRPPYGRGFVDRPRQGVLLGTTNSDDYLRDSTGNRRIWPVHCQTVDVNWIRLNRDQLWAEAATREATGEAIWLSDDTASKLAVTAQANRLAEVPWERAVMEYVTPFRRIQIPDVLRQAIGLSLDKQTRRNVLDVAEILKRNGWTRWVGRLVGKPGAQRLWLSPGTPAPEPVTDPDENTEEE